MAANPLLRPNEVAQILKDTASGGGAWTPSLGYGILDVAAAVARAQGRPSVSLSGTRSRGRLRLTWSGHGASVFRLSLRIDRGPVRVLLPATSRTATTHRLQPGRRYAFTVAALDGTGTQTASSAFSIRG